MQFPDKPTCHSPAGVFKVDEILWREPRDGQAWRTCSYCGSVHPEDLLRLIEEGAKLGGADWKYGWPHKFYVTGPTVRHAKIYNVHLRDEGFDEDALSALFASLHQHGGILFHLDPDEGRLRYAAPYAGYQRP